MSALIPISSIPPKETVYLTEQTWSDMGLLEANQGVIVIAHDIEGSATSVYLENDDSGVIYCIDPVTVVTRNPHPSHE